MRILLIVVTALLAYLFLWPVQINPIAWNAPDNKGYIGVYTPNTKLANLDLIDLDHARGPEDIASRYIDGALKLFVSSQNGIILKIDAGTGSSEIFADTGGVPLGIEFDQHHNLIVADAFNGLLSINPQGHITTLTDHVDSQPILYADDIDIGPDGIIYFSDASTKWSAKAIGNTMTASLYEIMEHGRSGRVIAYDPTTTVTTVIKDQLSFANGVAMGPNGKSILVVETGEYRIHRIWIAGSQQGKSEIIIDNLPGFPDNINRAPEPGTYYVGLVSKRSSLLDHLSTKPFWRKVSWRLPSFLRPKAIDHGFILHIDYRGQVLNTWQDPSGKYPTTTGAHAPGDGYLYISSLTSKKLGRLAHRSQ